MARIAIVTNGESEMRFWWEELLQELGIPREKVAFGSTTDIAEGRLSEVDLVLLDARAELSKPGISENREAFESDTARAREKRQECEALEKQFFANTEGKLRVQVMPTGWNHLNIVETRPAWYATDGMVLLQGGTDTIVIDQIKYLLALYAR